MGIIRIAISHLESLPALSAGSGKCVAHCCMLVGRGDGQIPEMLICQLQCFSPRFAQSPQLSAPRNTPDISSDPPVYGSPIVRTPLWREGLVVAPEVF